MLVFTLIVIVLLVALRVIIRKPVKTVKTVKARTLTRHENAIGRATDRMGW